MKVLLITISLVLLYAQESLAQLYTNDERPTEWCMAQNIYYEARGSSLADQAAVADVVLNRMQDRRYPNTICEVVKQGVKHEGGKMERNKYKFS
jgi:spore germination cell wall hydrolase CwlJ-like protein